MAQARSSPPVVVLPCVKEVATLTQIFFVIIPDTLGYPQVMSLATEFMKHLQYPLDKIWSRSHAAA